MQNKLFYETLMRDLLLKVDNSSENPDIPVAAALLNSENQMVSITTNSNIIKNDPTAHAEINSLRDACQTLKTSRLDGLSLIVTLEPCLMCAGAIIQSRINRVIFGAFEPKTGFMSSLHPTIKEYVPHIEIIGGILETKCSRVMSNLSLIHI